ncbi:hypothetical protein HYFRA_00004476 [Hymenoscyphus fraxineus]|uniref:DUF7708 domain-containing protein n=1 Tax=Hymenoscyphus fraxineus TaxID=746836 RepID=A0A9N9PIK6_9HELO|nr:hypothetical protein HYFRA_00004476 [Hymenoscyphus fraxineus]
MPSPRKERGSISCDTRTQPSFLDPAQLEYLHKVSNPQGSKAYGMMQSAKDWYEGIDDDRHLDIAQAAFRSALDIFGTSITEDTRKKDIAKTVTSIDVLEEVVQNTKSKYESRHKGSKAQKWLIRISHRIRFYGNIGDVLVQQHPEYVSLAWGAFKLLFILVENQEKLVTTLAKGLSQIADSLPKIELSTILYPTLRMKRAVAQLYAHIINFLIRAKDWYEESKLRHMINAFARPAKLRYDDIIKEIESCTKEIDQLSTASARAEQRDIHLELRELSRRQKEAEWRKDERDRKAEEDSTKVLLEIRQLCISAQSLQSAGSVDTNQRLSDIQLNLIMDHLAKPHTLDPLKSLQLCYNAYAMSTMKSKRKAFPDVPFWFHPKFAHWKSPDGSALIMVKGDYKTRQMTQEFAVNVVNLLRRAEIPVVWVLKSPRESSSTVALCAVDLVKSLICQILGLNISLHTERQMSLSCAQFRAAETLSQWFNLLGMVLEQVPLLYIILDIEAVGASYSRNTEEFSWLSCFSSMLQKLLKQQPKMKLKILLVSYGSASLQEPRLSFYQDLVVSTRQSIHGLSQRRKMEHMKSRRIISRAE